MNIRYWFCFRINAVLLVALLFVQTSVYAEGAWRSKSTPLGAKGDPSSGHASNPVGVNAWAPTNWQSIRPPSLSTFTSSYSKNVPDMWGIEWWPFEPLENTSTLSWEIEWVNSRPLSIDMIMIDWWSMEWSREMAAFRIITPRSTSSSNPRDFFREQKRRNDFGFSPGGGHGGGRSGGSSSGSSGGSS